MSYERRTQNIGTSDQKKHNKIINKSEMKQAKVKKIKIKTLRDTVKGNRT